MCTKRFFLFFCFLLILVGCGSSSSDPAPTSSLLVEFHHLAGSDDLDLDGSAGAPLLYSHGNVAFNVSKLHYYLSSKNIRRKKRMAQRSRNFKN